MARNRSELVIIYWRDIPAQVNAQVGRERFKAMMPDRFGRGIDRAKRKAKIYTSHEDIAQWRRENRPLTGDPQAAANAVAAELDAAFPHERLRELIVAAGFDENATEVSQEQEQS